MRTKHKSGPENGPQKTDLSNQKSETIDLIPRKGPQRSEVRNQPSDLVGNLRWWSRHHNWDEPSMLTNKLKLRLAFAKDIRTAVNEFMADGQILLAMQIKAEFARLQDTVRELDRTCVKRVDAEDEYLRLQKKKEELAESLCDLATMLESGYRTEAGKSNEQWVSTTQAGKVLGVHRSTVTKWAKKGRFTDNGQKGQKKRLSMASVLLVKREIDNDCLKGYSDEL